MKRAIYPGTFDPITNGHLDIVSRAAEIFDEVIIAAIRLPKHKKAPMFSIEERLEIIGKAVISKGLQNVKVDSFSELVVEYAKKQEAQALVRGLRAISDFDDEFEINQINAHQAPEIESVYFMTAPHYSFVSSSGIKELAYFGGKIEDLVPEISYQALIKKMQEMQE